MNESSVEREQAAYSSLRRFGIEDSTAGAGKWTPAWSSAMLDATVDDLISRSNSGVTSLFRALWNLLTETGEPLARATANFIRDIVVAAFTRHRTQYDASDFT